MLLSELGTLFFQQNYRWKFTKIYEKIKHFSILWSKKGKIFKDNETQPLHKTQSIKFCVRWFGLSNMVYQIISFRKAQQAAFER